MFNINSPEAFLTNVEAVIVMPSQINSDYHLLAIHRGYQTKLTQGTSEEMKVLKDKVRDAIIAHSIVPRGYFDIETEQFISVEKTV